MAIVRCPAGHYYDNRKFLLCPACLSQNTAGPAENEKTVGVAEYELDDEQTLGYSQPADAFEEERTVGIADETPWQPVVGWLVCIEGDVLGKDYRLHRGRNFAGRSPVSDIWLEEAAVSRERHFEVIYDERHGAFLLAPGEGTLTYQNNTLLQTAQPLCDDDEIRAGGLTLCFRSFCRGKRTWQST